MKTILVISVLVLLSVPTWAQESGLTLDEALLLAAERYPILQAVGLEAEAAVQRADQAGAWLNPGVFLRMESAPRKGDVWGGSERIVGLSQDIAFSGRLGAAREVARFEAGQLDQVRALTSREVEAAVRTAHAEALHARDALELWHEGVEVARHLLELASERVAAGDAPRVDEGRAHMELGAAEAALGAARVAEMDARNKLAATVGIDLMEIGAVAGELMTDPSIPDLDELIARIDHSPRNLLEGARVATEEARITEASRLRYPDLELEAGLRTAPDGDSFDAGVRLAVPLFDGGGARLSAARAEAAAAQWRAQSQRRNLELAVRRAHAELTVSVEGARLYSEVVIPEATAAVRAAEAVYAVGDADLTDVLQITRDWIDARRLQLDLILAEARARATLVELL